MTWCEIVRQISYSYFKMYFYIPNFASIIRRFDLVYQIQPTHVINFKFSVQDSAISRIYIVVLLREFYAMIDPESSS